MRVAIEGCAHGELERIYDSVEALAEMGQEAIDLLICCGDFQATRNVDDLSTVAAPLKFQKMCTFYKYYTGEKVAPVLTLFVGGNHEASNYLQELPYGGWVAPNIYYLGYSGVVNYGGLRIAGISGIFKGQDHHKGRFERVPYSESSKRSVYHVRNLDVFRLKQVHPEDAEKLRSERLLENMKSPIDIFISHDWPQGVYNFGDKNNLIRMKPFFKDEVETDSLGSPVNSELLFELKPKHWFAAHLHVKFAALIPHKDEDGNVAEVTKFLALDKCLPKRKFLQIVTIEHDPALELKLEYDLEWLAILHFTNHLISVDSSMNYLPNSSTANNERWIFTPTEEEKSFISDKIGDLTVPLNFKATVPGHQPEGSPNKRWIQRPTLNPQTISFCKKLGIDDPIALLLAAQGQVGEERSTPDRSDPNMSSFIDSELSGFCSGSDDNDKSESNELDCKESPTSRRSTLQLPAPKFNLEEGTEEIAITVNTAGPPLFVIDDGTKRCAEESTPPSTPSLGQKKFKRRNQELYMNSEDS